MTRIDMAQLPISDVKNSNEDDRDREGGTSVTVSTLGPNLPPESCIDEQENEEEDMYGPELPPGFNQERDKGRKRVLGPCLPPAGVSLQSTTPCMKPEDDEAIVGPVLPAELVENSNLSVVAAAVEARAKAMKNKLEGKPNKSVNVKQRESWMTELPPERNVNKIQLGPRTFRKKDFDLGDRSVWTDTPADRLKKAQTSEEVSSCASHPAARDIPGLEHEREQKDWEIKKHIEEYNKEQRGESLIDMHRRKRKHDVAGGSESVRRPFDRETDLEVPKLDTSKRRKMMEESSKLSNRFGRTSLL